MVSIPFITCVAGCRRHSDPATTTLVRRTSDGFWMRCPLLGEGMAGGEIGLTYPPTPWSPRPDSLTAPGAET
jgi:hypothetical protein